MKKQIKSRLTALKAEYKKGQERLAALEQETAQVKTSMLRISGAIQVLEELAGESETAISKEEIIQNGTT